MWSRETQMLSFDLFTFDYYTSTQLIGWGKYIGNLFLDPSDMRQNGKTEQRDKNRTKEIENCFFFSPTSQHFSNYASHVPVFIVYWGFARPPEKPLWLATFKLTMEKEFHLQFKFDYSFFYSSVKVHLGKLTETDFPRGVPHSATWPDR